MSFNFLKKDFNSDPNIGLYGFATDSYCLLGKVLPDKLKTEIEKSLEVKVKTASILGTELIGIFLAGNSNGILLPSLVYNEEIKNIKSQFPKLNIHILETNYTALGNLILCNDNGALISKKIEKFQAQIKNCLNVPVQVGEIAELDIVGSAARASNKGCLCHRDCSDSEAKQIENLLKAKVDIGSVNFGTPYIKAGIIVNSHGVLTSTQTTGPELGRISETFE